MYSLFTKNKKYKHKELARTYAMQCLYTWYMSGNNIRSIIKYFLKTKNIKKFNIIFFYKITLGVILHKTQINKFFLLHKKNPISTYHVIEILIIKICIFELLYKKKNEKYNTQHLYNTTQLLHKFCRFSYINFIHRLIYNAYITYNLQSI
jgi:transcription termination factor NusB